MAQRNKASEREGRKGAEKETGTREETESSQKANVMELKRIDFTGNSITGASGKKYLIHNSLSEPRYEIMERLNIEIMFGRGPGNMYRELAKVYDLLNKAKFADASVSVHNLLNSTAAITDGRKHQMLMLCTLFISGEDEDLTTWSEAEANEKISDWKEYDVQDFFALALSSLEEYKVALLPGFLDSFEVSPEAAEMN